jgi:PAS domain S-box-containing protein
MSVSDRTALQRYGFAVFAVAVSIGLRALLDPVLGSSTPFILLYPAIAIAALYGGARAGLLATILGVLCADFFFMDPAVGFAAPGSREFVQVVVLVLMAALISWIVSDREKINAQLESTRVESERRSREAAQALITNKERARLAESAASVGIWEWDLDSNAVDWSEGIYELLGIEPYSVPPSVDIWQRAMLPDELASAQAVIKRYIDEGSAEFYDEFRMLRRDDGRVRWLATKGKIIRQDGAAVRLFGVNYDITEMKEKELKIGELNRELRRRVSELQAIFDLAPVGIAVAADAGCEVITANPALAQMVGVKPGENIASGPVKLPYKHFKSGRELADDELPMQRAVAEKRTIINEEIEIERADGSKITIYSYAAPVFDENGEVISCVAAQIDITDRKQQEVKQELALGTEQALRKEAEEANRLKDEFLATVSHELRTPLNSIIGWTAMLRDKSIDNEMRSRAVAAVERSARSQSQLIEDLLDVSRIITGKLELKVQPVDITGVAAAAIETLGPAAEAKDIAVALHSTADSVLISGDRDRLQQIVWNLLSNAIKFTQRGGHVDIDVRQAGPEVELVIADDGKGISPDFLPLVFDRFRQADGSITRSFTGLGLGLSIVRHLVELHGGTVTVASDGEGAGAAFTIRLPAIQSHAEPPAAPTVAPSQMFPELEGRRVLIVDDEVDTREILEFAFEKYGVSVTCAGSAAEALAAIKEVRLDLIISDIGMPSEDGYALMEKIRHWENTVAAAATPAIALTAYARAEDRERAIEAGFQAHVAKPVEPLHLLGLASEMLSGEHGG